MIVLCLFQFSSNILLHKHFDLNFLKSLFDTMFDTMLKRYQKKKKDIFSSPNAFFGAKLAKKEKMSKKK